MTKPLQHGQLSAFWASRHSLPSDYGTGGDELRADHGHSEHEAPFTGSDDLKGWVAQGLRELS